MKRSVVTIGHKINMLTVVGIAPIRENGATRVFCKCDCGAIRDFDYSYLKVGIVKSCGCYQKNRRRVERITHDMSSTRVYRIYQGMIQRCTNPKAVQFKNYGGRGICVCDRWLNSFEDFYSDMGDPPSLQHSLDRYPNNDGNYELMNCRWATTKEQRRNARTNIFFEKNGLRMTQYDWTLYFGVSRNAIGNRIKNGKTFDEIYDDYFKKGRIKNLSDMQKLLS